MLIVLCGFMGAGKTSKGKLLAAELNSDYCDLDDLIVDKIGMPIKQYFNEFGETEFRNIESEILKNLLGSNLVLSLGGGALDRIENRIICSNAKVIYLNTPFETCYKRICHSERPMVKLKTYTELKELYVKRSLIYTLCADKIIKTDDFNEDKHDIINEMLKFCNNS